MCQICVFLIAAPPTISAFPQGASNPCNPNPCGEHNICKANGGAVSCKCEIGYSNTDPNDLYLCVKDGVGSTVSSGSSNGVLDIPSRTSHSSGAIQEQENHEAATTDRPSFLPPKETVIGFDENGREVVFTSAVVQQTNVPQSKTHKNVNTNSRNIRPIAKNPISAQNQHSGSRNVGQSGDGHRLSGLAIDKIFDAECLSSDDCGNDEYCNVEVDLCQHACSLNVCGEGAECKGKLHRPLCYCPKGFDGNPHERCNKAKSRAGTKFRK